MKHLRTLLASLALCSLSIFAQSDANKGQISGTVFDQNNAVIPNAKITVKNLANGLARDVTTGREGQYRAVLLDPWNHRRCASCDGS